MKFISHLIKPNITIFQALKILKKTGDKCLLVADSKKNLLGTLTDGDIRSALIKGQDLKTNIKKFYNKKPKFINFNQRNDKNIITIYYRSIGCFYSLVPINITSIYIKRIN